VGKQVHPSYAETEPQQTDIMLSVLADTLHRSAVGSTTCYPLQLHRVSIAT
jgi:hypothetical protein